MALASRSAVGLLALAILVLTIGGPEVSQALAPTTRLPLQLQALEQKMQGLQINSERLSEITRGRITVVDETNGRPSGPVKHVSLNSDTIGEASVIPAEGAIFKLHPRRAVLIAIGSSVFARDRSLKRRPWVRSPSHGESPAGLILPFQGGGSAELSLGGTGSYAGLFNLLGTATQPVVADGTVMVGDQATSEFTATVEPRELIKGLTTEDVANFEKQPPIEKLHLFLTESGLPVRVVSRISLRHFNESETIEILSINQPVSIKPPSGRVTRQPSK
ncbi:MAG TPA: hypothetical protein VH061_13615 [Solirubrobacteraceae bacterium]|jgi:hypothetical protein|nr:hypothetical protein [Solirubrobacteraceae bacterium]